MRPQKQRGNLPDDAPARPHSRAALDPTHVCQELFDIPAPATDSYPDTPVQDSACLPATARQGLRPDATRQALRLHPARSSQGGNLAATDDLGWPGQMHDSII